MKIKTEANEISVSNYQKILDEIKKQISQTQKNILKNVTRQKVEMAWQIGKIIDQDLSKKDEKTYGKNLIGSLEKDVGISGDTLYKMRRFYKTYPKIPKDDERLNWSHYRVLSGIKKADERKVLEDLTKQNGWEVNELQQEVTKTRISQIRENKAAKAVGVKNIPVKKKLSVIRGKLFSYYVKKIIGTEKYCLDCGFGVFREIAETLPRELWKDGEVVTTDKIPLFKASELSRSEAKRNDGAKQYSIKKLTAKAQQLHTYKAYLERVVDGDTIRVNLDLGFGIFHREILRLAKINAPEIALVEGKRSKEVLSAILKDVLFLVIKTTKTDIYGRYVADVFLAGKGELDGHKVAQSGVYLNQLLLDEGVVVSVD